MCSSRALLLLALLTGVFAPSSRGQLHQTTAAFLEHHPQARVHALGHATVALDGYTGAIGINPASVGERGALRVATNVSTGPLLASDWRPALFDDLWLATPSLSAQVRRIGVAIQVKYIQRTTDLIREDGILLDRVEQDGWAATIAGSYDLNSDLTGGAALRLIRQQFLNVGEEGKLRSTTPALDVGLRYERSYGLSQATVRPMLGWSLMNVGPTVALDAAGPGDWALPMKMRLGTAVDVASTFFPQDRPLLRLVVVGALTKPLTNFETKTGMFDSGRTFTYLDADGPLTALFDSGWESKAGTVNRNGQGAQLSVWEQTTRHVGVELRIQDLVSLRWGRFHEDEQTGGRQFTTLGFGFEFYYAALEHSWTVGDGPSDNSFWRLTARVPLTEDAPRSWFPLGD